MVWLVEKKIFHHLLDLEIEKVRIPIRVKFEFEVKEGSFVRDSISTHVLYNEQAIRKYYPELRSDSLKDGIDKTVKQEIEIYLKERGFLNTGEAVLDQK